MTRYFGGLAAVWDLNFSLEKNEVQSVIGPNWAGKSTFFKLITGELKPSRGRIWFQGENITELDQHLISRKGIATSYQITNIFPKLSVFENVRIAAQAKTTAYNFWSKASAKSEINGKAESILKKIRLWNKRDTRAANLSYGEQRHLELGVALGTAPFLLLLDEPTSGLSPWETRETVDLIREIAPGLSLILVEHKMKVVMALSNQITVLHEGKIIARGSPKEIQENELVRKVYLGSVRG